MCVPKACASRLFLWKKYQGWVRVSSIMLNFCYSFRLMLYLHNKNKNNKDAKLGLKMGLTAMLLTIFLCVFANQSFAASKKIYVWRDAKGVLVFSDTQQPEVDAEEIKLNSKAIDMKPVDTSILNDNKKNKTIKFSIDITSPIHEETIRDNTGSIHINGRNEPRFIPGHKVQLYLDGVKYGHPKASLLFVIRNIDRGEHTLQLGLIDEKGKSLAKSKTITLFLHRRSIISGP